MRRGDTADLSVREFQNWKSWTVSGRQTCLDLGLQGSVHLITRHGTIITQRNEMNQLNKRLREIHLFWCVSRSIQQLRHFEIHNPDFRFWVKISGLIVTLTMILVLHIRLLLVSLSPLILPLGYNLLVYYIILHYIILYYIMLCYIIILYNIISNN